MSNILIQYKLNLKKEKWETKEVMKSKKKNKFSTLSATESDKIRKVSQSVYNLVIKELKNKHNVNNGQELIDDARAMIAKYSK